MLITGFQAGELSHRLNGRVDIQQYYQAASHLENFDIIPTGGITRRSGTKRVAKLHADSRIIPFIVDKDLSFILEFLPNKIYYYRTDDFSNSTQDGEEQNVLTSPYNSISECNEIHFAQDYDTLILVQKNHKPIMLKYNIATQNFELTEMAFVFYPNVQLDDDYKIVQVVDGDVTLPAEKENEKIQYCIFKGEFYKYKSLGTWEVQGTARNTDDDNLFTSEGKYPSAVAFFNNRLFFASTEGDRQKVWASSAPNEKGTRYLNFSTYQRYITINKVIKDADLHVFTADVLQSMNPENAHQTILTGLSQSFREEENVLKDGKKITDYYITNEKYFPAGAKVINYDRISGNMTVDCQITGDLKTQSIDATTGQEKTERRDLNRIVFSLSLWKNADAASADDYEYTIQSQDMTTSDCSFNFSLASDQNDAIRWLGANKYLVIGTESSVWCMPSSVTALNVQVEMNGRYGSDTIQAHCVDTAMIYFSQGKMGIREYYYSSQAEAFQTNDIALLAEQMLTESPAVDFDFMTNPFNKIVIARADGKVVGLLYDKNNGVMGWNRMTMKYNKIKDCAVTRGDKQYDVLYFVVEEAGKYYLEKLDESETEKVYLDSYSVFDEAKTDYTGRETLWNKTNGKTCSLEWFISQETTDAERGEFRKIKTDTEVGDEVFIGYEYESIVKSMPVVQSEANCKKRIVELLVRFLESAMPVIKCDGLPEEHFSNDDNFSGVKKITFPGMSERDVYFTIKTDGVKNVTILSVEAKLS